MRSPYEAGSRQPVTQLDSGFLATAFDGDKSSILILDDVQTGTAMATLVLNQAKDRYAIKDGRGFRFEREIVRTDQEVST